MRALQQARAAAKTVRRWRSKRPPAAGLRRRARRLVKIGTERLKNARRRGGLWLAGSARLVRQLVAYEVAGEAARCPSCGSDRITHLEPLQLSAAPDVRWRFGFISGCRRCGLIFANPLPAAEAIEATYSAAGDWGRSRQEEHEGQVSRRRLAELFAPAAPDLDVLQPPPGARVLDVGCGLGGMLDAFAAAGWETYGLDPATKIAFRRHREVTEIPGEPMFDLVILHHVLEHVTDPLAIVERVAKATRPGGLLLVSVPNLDAVGEHGELEYCIRSRIHVTAYTVRALEWLCASAGFRLLSSGGGTERFPKRQVVLARRETGEVPPPAEPLAAAEAALRAYYARHPGQRAPLPMFPVRVRAALASIARRGVRKMIS